MEELEVEEEGNNGGGRGVGLRLSLRFDPRNLPLDHALFSFPVSALLGNLGWSKNSYWRQQESPVIAEDGGESTVAVAIVAAAIAVCLSVMFVSDRQPRRPRRRRSARTLALPGSCDGLRVLSNDESPGRVVQGVSVTASLVLAASTETETTETDMAGANAGEETEEVQLQKDEEAEQLREMWMSLLEREQKLELRMLELCGLKEHEATVRELENRLNVAAVEARLLELKVESVQKENQSLKAQVSELEDVKAKLERSKDKLKAMKRRVEAEQEEARRTAASLVKQMEHVERDRAERVTEMEAEATALRKANAGLEEENSELVLRLQDAEHLASPVNLALEEDILEEANFLREANKRLSKQIEQLHSDHWAHVEELVYLKWVNACLRHELRSHDGDHHGPSSGQQEEQKGSSHALSAMDLSKSMSYRSSEKAKQLMLEYGHLPVEGFDPGLFSPLHESHNGEPERSPDPPATAAAATPVMRAGQSKLKFLGNIKKLLRGHGHGHSHRKSKKLPDDEQLSKAMRWLASHDVLDGGNSSYESTPTSSCVRTPASSVTTVESRARGDRGQASAAMPGTRRLEAETARSKSDVGASYRREVGRYHALRPDHPAELGELHFKDFRSPEMQRDVHGLEQ